MPKYVFPEGFLWGAAASAYQTEGNNIHNDWHDAERKEQQKPTGKRRLAECCGDACDHWNRYEEDYDLAREMGIQMHRLSIEWSRIFPAENEVDHNAIAQYRAMMQALRSRGIKVMLCQHHFTIPRWVLAKGGFEKRRVFMTHFERYLQTIVPAVGDLVDYWLPINEPNVVPLAGFFGKLFPPFKANFLAFVKVYRTFFAMHARSYRVIKAHFPEAPVGVAFAFMHFQPYNPANILHRWGAAFANRAANLCFFEAVKTGRIGFPLGLGDTIPELRGAMDFVGLNYYTTLYMKGLRPVEKKPGDLVTDMGWILYPQGLYEILQYLGRSIDLPIIVTENGVATTDENFRIQYLEAHLREVHRAIQEGVPVKGYMCWSLTDNFEWQHGYKMRFGLIHVDFSTQKRTIKAGGSWYGGVIRENGLLVLDV
jgi:beta-glucosidase